MSGLKLECHGEGNKVSFKRAISKGYAVGSGTERWKAGARLDNSPELQWNLSVSMECAKRRAAGGGVLNPCCVMGVGTLIEAPASFPIPGPIKTRGAP